MKPLARLRQRALVEQRIRVASAHDPTILALHLRVKRAEQWQTVWSKIEDMRRQARELELDATLLQALLTIDVQQMASNRMLRNRLIAEFWFQESTGCPYFVWEQSLKVLEK